PGACAAHGCGGCGGGGIRLRRGCQLHRLSPWPDGSRCPAGGSVRCMPVSSPADLIEVPEAARVLGAAFAAAGHDLHLVGGTVRDALMRRASQDLDFATDARPDQTQAILETLASSVWTTGIDFGTIGAQVNGVMCEITTYRADRYDRVSRNPVVVYGDSLEDDLRRRDF